MSEDRLELVKALEVVARSWLDRDFATLASTLHHDVIFRGPDGHQAIEGRETCLNSYVAFMDQAEVQSFTTGDAVIDLLGETAVVLQPWSIRYRMNEKDHDEKGSDIYIFRRESGRWQLVWRGAGQSS